MALSSSAPTRHLGSRPLGSSGASKYGAGSPASLPVVPGPSAWRASHWRPVRRRAAASHDAARVSWDIAPKSLDVALESPDIGPARAAFMLRHTTLDRRLVTSDRRPETLDQGGETFARCLATLARCSLIRSSVMRRGHGACRLSIDVTRRCLGVSRRWSAVGGTGSSSLDNVTMSRNAELTSVDTEPVSGDANSASAGTAQTARDGGSVFLDAGPLSRASGRRFQTSARCRVTLPQRLFNRRALRESIPAGRPARSRR